MASPVVRNDAIATLPEEQHLAVPVVRSQRPAMRKHDRLPLAPILVIDLRTVFGCNRCHFSPPQVLLCELENLLLRDYTRTPKTHAARRTRVCRMALKRGALRSAAPARETACPWPLLRRSPVSL